MGPGAKIAELRAGKGISQTELGELLGTTKQTIYKYETGLVTNIPLDKVERIAEILEVSPAYLMGWDTPKKSPSPSDEAMKLARDYDGLDHWGKRQVRSAADIEMARCEDGTRLLAETTPDLEPEPKVIPLYWSAPAAGIASPILGEDYDLYELTADDPQGAMFAVRVGGDSMEPYFPDGSIAFCNKDPLQEGDVGVFSVDGGGVIKQYYYDPVLKMTYLFSLNRKRADADLLITSTSGQTLTCLGRCLTRRRFPVPGRG